MRFDLRPRLGLREEWETGPHESAEAGGSSGVALWRIKGELERGTGVVSTSLICGLTVPRESEEGACGG